MPSRSPCPRGREAVEDALLEAAGQLFAAYGPRATSVRQIATAAGVNHGLVHHYFGSKGALLRAVLERSAAQLAEHPAAQLATDPDLLDKLDLHWRILARALLDGTEPDSLQRSYPVIDQLVGECKALGMNEREARETAARTVATEVGWRMLRGFIVGALQLDDATTERFDHGGLIRSPLVSSA
jgi:TetR/AcrR family transcriptional regulator, repressor for neighboring sulfatase